jgi:myosin heavy subunit
VLKKEHAATVIQKVARGWMVRKQYKATRDYVIRLQTCIRQRQARKQLIVLRAEARSVSHLKEASYKLESRVVDLISSLIQQKEEKSKLKLQAVELENRIKDWMQNYEKVDQRAKSLEQSLTNGSKPISTNNNDVWLQLKEKREALQNEYIVSLNKIKSQDKELLRLKEELLHQKDDVAKLRVASKSTRKSNESDITELKNQISALKAATEYKLFVQ